MNTSAKEGRFEEALYRRRFPRRLFFRAVGILVGGKYTMESGVEIGEGGLLLESKRDLKIGNNIVVNLFVPKGSFVTVTGQIIYVLAPKEKLPVLKDPAYGIKFNNLTFESKRMIRDYIAEKTFGEAQSDRV
jgi:hypothetical protein